LNISWLGVVLAVVFKLAAAVLVVRGSLVIYQ
jgi:hypothetical protein